MTISYESRWGTRRVKTLTTKIGSGKTPSGGSESYLASGVTFLRSQNVHFDGLRLDDVAYISEVTHREMRGTRVKPNDVLLNITGASLGRVSRVPEDLGEANVNQHVCIIRPNVEANARYLAYALSSQPVQEQISELQVGGNREGLNFEQVGNLNVPAALSEEQRRIADFLDAETARIDALARRRRVQQHLLVERRAALKTKCVTYSGPRKVHHPLLGDTHPDWQIRPLRRVLPAVNVGVVINPSHHFTESGVPFIHGFNVREGFISSADMKFMSSESNELHKRSRVLTGDVLVVRAGATAGRAARVSEEFDGANCASVLILRKSETLDAAYLETFFNAVPGKGQVSFSQYGAAQEVISAGQVSSFSIALPPISEQVERVAELSAATAETVALEAGLTRQVALLSERRQALITAAVTGQFDVSTASGRNVTDGVTA
ncbi:restriction endonuclease subunit S [Streptomyces sp. NPDC050121]|uniref:restriction endonuclease subunit S n=1 Tax=Streptomyces sp. NPDC050121 TaxID=3365601 RepID=UPI0037B11626